MGLIHRFPKLSLALSGLLAFAVIASAAALQRPGGMQVAGLTADNVTAAVIKVDADGVVQTNGTGTITGTVDVDVVANSIGLATGAKQDTGNTSLASIKTNTDTLAGGVTGGTYKISASDGSAISPVTDPCDGAAKTVYVVNMATATTNEVANAVASQYWHICSINLVAAGADGVLIASDDTDGCGSITAGLNGGTTAATGWNFAANGGIALGTGAGTVMKSATVNHYLCIATSQAVQLSGTIAYVSAP